MSCESSSPFAGPNPNYSRVFAFFIFRTPNDTSNGTRDFLIENRLEGCSSVRGAPKSARGIGHHKRFWISRLKAQVTHPSTHVCWPNTSPIEPFEITFGEFSGRFLLGIRLGHGNDQYTTHRKVMDDWSKFSPRFQREDLLFQLRHMVRSYTIGHDRKYGIRFRKCSNSDSRLRTLASMSVPYFISFDAERSS